MESFDESLKFLLHEEPEESELYKSIFAKGEERGRSQGLSQGLSQGAARTICKLLTRHLGPLEPGIHERLASWSHPETLDAWEDEAIALKDKTAAHKLLQEILKTPLPPPADGSSRAA